MIGSHFVLPLHEGCPHEERPYVKKSMYVKLQANAFSDLEDLLDASHKMVEESVDSRTRSQQGSPAVTRDSIRQVELLLFNEGIDFGLH